MSALLGWTRPPTARSDHRLASIGGGAIRVSLCGRYRTTVETDMTDGVTHPTPLRPCAVCLEMEQVEAPAEARL